MITHKDILKYATKDEIKFLKEEGEEIGEAPTDQKIEEEDTKLKLRLYTQIFSNLISSYFALLDMPPEYIDGEMFGPEGKLKQVYNEVKRIKKELEKGGE